MANLSPQQEAINRIHLQHQARGTRYEPECPECKRQQNWQPPTTKCNWCDIRIPVGDQKRAIEHNEWHLAQLDKETSGE